MTVRLLLDTQTVAGLALALIFLAVHRPTRLFGLQAINAAGLAWAVLLVYLRTAILYSMRGLWDDPVSGGASFDNVTSVALGYLIIALLLLRLWTFFVFRRLYIKHKLDE